MRTIENSRKMMAIPMWMITINLIQAKNIHVICIISWNEILFQKIGFVCHTYPFHVGVYSSENDWEPPGRRRWLYQCGQWVWTSYGQQNSHFKYITVLKLSPIPIFFLSHLPVSCRGKHPWERLRTPGRRWPYRCGQWLWTSYGLSFARLAPGPMGSFWAGQAHPGWDPPLRYCLLMCCPWLENEWTTKHVNSNA